MAKRMLKYAVKLQLQNKLLIWFLILSIIPSAFIALISYRNSTVALSDQLKNARLAQAKTLGSQVDRFIEERMKDLESLTKQAVYAQALSNVLGNGIVAAYYVDATGSVLTSVGAQTDRNMANDEWFAAVQSGNLYCGDCEVSEVLGRPTIKIASPIMASGNMFMGAVLEEIDMSAIQAIVDEVAATEKASGGSGYAFLVNRSGVVIAHPDQNKILNEQLLKSESRGLAAAVKDMIAGKEGVVSYTSSDGEKRVLVYTPLTGHGDYKGNGWGVGISLTASELYGPVTGLRNISISAILVIALIAIILAITISRGIARPLSRVADIAQAVATGDLSVEVPRISTGDEVETVAKAFSQMVTGLRNLVGQLRSSAEQVASTSEELSSSARESAKAILQISETVNQVASGAQEQSTSAASSASSVDQLSQLIGQVARGAESQVKSIRVASDAVSEMNNSLDKAMNMLETVGSTSSDNARAAAKGSQAAENVVASMEGIRTTTQEVADRIRELDAHSQEIGKILEVINDIAEQTNLLALNAAIEAARAGEHGRGFAVVADEVRKLAERSSRETKAIAALIGNIREATEKAVTAIDEGIKEVANGSQVAQEAGKTLNEIFQAATGAERMVSELILSSRALKDASLKVEKAINEIVAIADENTAATKTMAASAEGVRKSIDNVAAVSEQSAAAAEQVSASTEEMNASIQEMSASADSLSEMAKGLQSLVAKFKM
ncbi:MAG TPA: methyl-accepting chemotaxis protein [Firmicutes bacterium]|nr:methyl-accepting chemotaxis protein [Bacillota bacterium]